VKREAHSKNLRLHRLSDVPATFFVTKSLHPKKPVLDRSARQTIVSAFAFAVKRERIYLRAFVVMPDHLHALFALHADWTLPKFMHALMSYLGRETYQSLTAANTAWQEGYYETRIRTARQFEFVANYIERNPVVKGLVDQSTGWETCSVVRNDLITDPWPWFFDEESRH